MNIRRISVVTLLAVAATSTSIAVAQQTTKDAKKPTAAAPEHQQMQLPPGMTEADMMACMEAGTPGEMHALLLKDVGVWHGKQTMWMTPSAEPVMTECTSTVTPMMDGRFVRCEMAGDIPGMGPFNGFGIYGFDNVSQRFQSTWIDNCGTGMMVGAGELASDNKTLTWSFTYNCPITQKPTTMREVDRSTGKDTKTMEMYAIDPKSGKEFKMLEIAFKRTSSNAPVTKAH